MNTSVDVLTIVRDTMRTHAFDNSGNLPPSRRDTLAMQLGQLLLQPHADGAQALGATLNQQGVGIRSLFAVMHSLQTEYLQHSDHDAALDVARRMGSVVEGFLDQCVRKVREEQERIRRAAAQASQSALENQQ